MVNYWQCLIGSVTAKWCNNCGYHKAKRVGYTRKESQRFQCKFCKTTYSKKKSSPTNNFRINNLDNWLEHGHGEKLENHVKVSAIQVDRCIDAAMQNAIAQLCTQPTVDNVATTSYLLPFKGGSCWVAISCCTTTGKVLWVTPMCIPTRLPNEGCYSTTRPDTYITSELGALEQAEHRENVFLERPQFDLIDIGACKLSSSRYSAALPVLTAHTHFHLLRKLGHGSNTHILEHEIFLRGACITQYSSDVKEIGTALFYFVGSTQGQGKFEQSKRIGWWKNIWHEYRLENKGGYALSQICGTRRNINTEIPCLSLVSVREFVEFLQPYQPIIATMTIHRAIGLLTMLAAKFNLTNTDA